MIRQTPALVNPTTVSALVHNRLEEGTEADDEKERERDRERLAVDEVRHEGADARAKDSSRAGKLPVNVRMSGTRVQNARNAGDSIKAAKFPRERNHSRQRLRRQKTRM